MRTEFQKERDDSQVQEAFEEILSETTEVHELFQAWDAGHYSDSEFLDHLKLLRERLNDQAHELVEERSRGECA